MTEQTQQPVEGVEYDETTDGPPQGADGAEQPQEPQEDTPEADEAAGDDEREPSSAEAARYRRRLRDAETERDALAEQLDAMRRAEAERIAGRHVSKPGSLWAAGTDVADLLDEHGRVDEHKVTAATTQAAETLGLARPRAGNVVPKEGAYSDPSKRSTADSMLATVMGRDEQ